MTRVRTIDGRQVRDLLDTSDLRRALAEGYTAVSSGAVDVPARIMARTPSGLMGAMPGYVPGVGLASKIVTVFPDNEDVPSHHGLIVLFDEDTGVPRAVLDGEVITEMRTSASAALAADLLAPAGARTLTIIGAGVQAEGHVEAFRPIRPWTEVRVANRDPSRAERLASRTGTTPVEDIGDAVDGADVVACTTNAVTPVFDPERFGGTHLSSVGLHGELPPRLVEMASVFVQSRDAVTTPPPNGPVEVQGLDPETVTELGEVVAGVRPGRTSPTQLTLWKSVGHAMEDVIAARLVVDRAHDRDVGGMLEL